MSVSVTGTLLLIPAEQHKPRKLIYLTKPPTINQIRALLGGPFELVPEFETIQHNAQLRECMAFCPEISFDARGHGNLPPTVNQWATILWGQSLARKYGPAKADPGDSIKRPVLVVTGDEEFLDAL